MQLTAAFFGFIAITGITVCVMATYFLVGVPSGVNLRPRQYSTTEIVEVSINDITISRPLRGGEFVSSDNRTAVTANDVKTPQPPTETEETPQPPTETEELPSVENATTTVLEHMFPLPPNFTFPQIHAVLPVSQVATMPWVQSLRSLLSKVDSKEINMVSANLAYKDVLLNWLISANVRSKIPLSKILVFALNLSLHRLLQHREIPSVYLPESLLSPHANFSRPYEKVMMLRLVVLRLLNYWGFDVVHYDIDAIVLKNPQPLFEKYSNRDIIGSIGTHPKEYYQDWGLTICLGFVMLRHTDKTEQYWNAMSETCTTSYDDQGQLNCGLKAIHTHWASVSNTNFKTMTVYGGAPNGLRVNVLPYNMVCRLETCQPRLRDHYYVWHKGGDRTTKEKQKSAQQGRTWFLRYQWSSIRNDFTGTEWLSSIAYYFTTHS